VTLSYDPLGRITSEINRLGTFGFAYLGATGLIQSATYPNGQTTQYSYFDNTGDDRLKQIVNQGPNKSSLSQFGYTYKATGEIMSLTTLARTYHSLTMRPASLRGLRLPTGALSRMPTTRRAIGSPKRSIRM
jgi:hypothetical protein